MYAWILRSSLTIVALGALPTAGDTPRRAQPVEPATTLVASRVPQPEMWQLVLLSVAAFGLTRRADTRKLSRFTI